MSSINWPEILTMFAGFGAVFVYMMSRLDAFRKELSDKIDANHRSLTEKIDAVEKDVHQVYSKVSNIEGQMTQMTRPNIIPITRHQEHHEKPLDDDGQDVQEC